MNPKDTFGIVIRSFGLLLLIYSLWYLAYGVATTVGMPERLPGYRTGYFISGSLFLVVSLYFLRGAALLLKFSYPEKRRSMGEEPTVLPPPLPPNP